MELEHIFKDIKIKSYIDQQNNPWFKGKDVATILGYKKTEKAIQTHVRDKNKKILNPSEMERLVGNEKATIYINEAGLYSLVLKSKMKQAEDFQEWVTSEVLPSIRKRGEYKLKQEVEKNKKLSIEFQQKLSIMDSRISEIQRQSELDKQNAEKEYALRLVKEKELAEKNKQIQLLTNHLKNHTTFVKDDLIYILTTDEDLKQNIFKVGKTTKKNLKSRLSTYNTGKSSESYYVYIKETVNALYIEKILDLLLKDFKLPVAFEDKSKEEMYKIHFDDLVKVLNCLIKAPNKTADFLNFNHEKIFKNSFSLDSVVERVKDWKTNEDTPEEIKDVKISVIKTPLKIDNTEKNVKRWFKNNIIKSENPSNFISMKNIVEKYREMFPHDRTLKKKDLERMIGSLFQNMGVYIKEEHEYKNSNGERKKTRRVFINYILTH